MRLYEFESLLEAGEKGKGDQMLLEVLIGEQPVFKSKEFDESIGSCLSKGITKALTQKEIEENISVTVLFYIRRTSGKAKQKEEPLLEMKNYENQKEEDGKGEIYRELEESKEESVAGCEENEQTGKEKAAQTPDSLVGKISLPLSQIIRRSLNKEEFRGALKVKNEGKNPKKKRESAVSIEKEDFESGVEEETQFIYEVAMKQNAKFSDFLLEKVNENCMGFLVAAITIKIDKSLSVFPICWS